MDKENKISHFFYASVSGNVAKPENYENMRIKYWKLQD